MHRRLRITMITAIGSALLCLHLTATVGDASGRSVPGRPVIPRSAGAVTVSADLDGDGEQEWVTMGRGRGGIEISDGRLSYRSRTKWWVAAATIADTDRDGRPEVTALLDDEGGRHLALIGWHAGMYHERLVSSVLPIRPLMLEARDDPGLGGWVVVLTETPPGSARRADPDMPSPTTTYRWNGFGFIAVAGEGAAR